MKTRQQNTRDRQENRFQREKPIAGQMETVRGKARRPGPAASRKKPLPSTKEALGIEIAFVPMVPAMPSPVRADLHNVSFKLHAPQAASVQLAGTFNDWTPGATTPSKANEGAWEFQVSLQPGTYEYKFIVDGI